MSPQQVKAASEIRKSWQDQKCAQKQPPNRGRGLRRLLETIRSGRKAG